MRRRGGGGVESDDMTTQGGEDPHDDLIARSLPADNEDDEEQAASPRENYSDLLWRTLCALAGSAMMLVAGTLYMFSVYGPKIKEEMGLTQTQLGLLGAMGSVGNYTGVFIGMFFDKCGGRAAALLSGLLLFIGYSGVYTVLKYGDHLHYATFYLVVICAFMFCVGQGSHGTYTASLMTNVKNFAPSHRGKVVGVLVSLFGLSGALFSQVYKLFFAAQGDVATFLLTMALVLVSVEWASSFFLKVIPPATNAQKLDEIATNRSDVELDILPSHSASDALLSPTETNKTMQESAEDSVRTHPADEELGHEILEQVELGDEQQKALDADQPIEIGVLAPIDPEAFVVKQEAFWYLFVIFYVGTGTGLMFFTHVGSQVNSLGGDASDRIVIVIILSLFNAAGRIVMGTASDLLQTRIPRLHFGISCVVLIAATCTALAFSDSVALVTLWTPFMAFAYGGLFSVFPILVSFTFGLSKFGQNWGWMAIAPALGSLSFGFLLSSIYDMHAIVVKTGEQEEHRCYGAECFRTTYLVCAAVNIGVAGVAMILVYRRQLLSTRFLLTP